MLELVKGRPAAWLDARLRACRTAGWSTVMLLGAAFGAFAASRAAAALSCARQEAAVAFTTPPRGLLTLLIVSGAVAGAGLAAGLLYCAKRGSGGRVAALAGAVCGIAWSGAALLRLPVYVVDQFEQRAVFAVVALWAVAGAAAARLVWERGGRYGRAARLTLVGAAASLALVGGLLTGSHRDAIARHTSSVRQLAEREDTRGLQGRIRECRARLATSAFDGPTVDPRDPWHAMQPAAGPDAWRADADRRVLEAAVDAYICTDPRGAISSPDPFVRNRAIVAIGALHGREFVPQLSQAMHDAFGSVRRSASIALAAIPGHCGYEVLAECAQDTNGSVRRNAIEGLAYVDLPAAERLVRRALRDPDQDVRTAAALALGKRGVRSVTAYLVEALRYGSCSDRVDAAEVLGDVGGSECVPQLIAALSDHRSAQATVASAAARSLGRLGDARAVPHLQQLVASGRSQDVAAGREALSRLRAPRRIRISAA